MWSRRQAAAGGGANGGIGGAAAWERHRIVELDALLPDPVLQRRSCTRMNRRMNIRCD
jgi:hypothetical protein